MRNGQKKKQEAVRNQRARDNGAKLIFDDPILCAQFLRGYTNVPLLKDVQPEEYFEHLEQNTPDYLLNLIGKIIAVFLYRLNIPRKEVEDFTDRIRRKEFCQQAGL